ARGRARKAIRDYPRDGQRRHSRGCRRTPLFGRKRRRRRRDWPRVPRQSVDLPANAITDSRRQHGASAVAVRAWPSLAAISGRGVSDLRVDRGAPAFSADELLFRKVLAGFQGFSRWRARRARLGGVSEVGEGALSVTLA